MADSEARSASTSVDLMRPERPTSSTARIIRLPPYLTLFSMSIPLLILLVVALGGDRADAQALNDPITQYIEGRLGNRSKLCHNGRS